MNHPPMSLERRLLLEWFEKHPNSSRAQCSKALGGSDTATLKKIIAVVRSGHLKSNGDMRIPKYRLTGKKFEPSDDFVAARWVKEKAAASVREALQHATTDTLAVSSNAMILVGRAQA
ncbi:hypothetical protein [Paraburkholderia sp. 2C]